MKVKSDEERRGLLSGVQDPEREHEHDPEPDLNFVGTSPQRSWSANQLACTAITCILLLVGGTFAHTFLLNVPTSQFASLNANDVFSNGTHDFKRTVLIVSIDGLR